jgi:hypothetical protein
MKLKGKLKATNEASTCSSALSRTVVDTLVAKRFDHHFLHPRVAAAAAAAAAGGGGGGEELQSVSTGPCTTSVTDVLRFIGHKSSTLP